LPGKHLGYKARDGVTHFIWGILLQEMGASYGDLLLIRPGSTEFALCSNQESSRVGINE
jgi:hypothetical protein